MADRLQVQGLCRFSFLCTGGFKKYHESIAERRAALYDPTRLDQRMLWFEHVCLPGIAGQTAKDFTLHILTGEDLPNPWRDRLEAAIKPVAQITLHVYPPIDHRAACREVLRGARHPDKESVAEFRLDDDDAVAVHFVGALRRSYPKIARLTNRAGRLALDQGRGMVLRAEPDGTISTHPLLTRSWAPGLAVYMPSDDTGTIMDFPHHRVWSRMPYLNLTERMMFIRGDHGHNDAQTPLGRDRATAA